jgi:hypothetical protein
MMAVPHFVKVNDLTLLVNQYYLIIAINSVVLFELKHCIYLKKDGRSPATLLE